jgi:hypothetical protein
MCRLTTHGNSTNALDLMDPLRLMTKEWSSAPGSAPEHYRFQALDEASEEFRLLTLVPSRDPKEPLRGTIRTVRVNWLEHASDPKYDGPTWTALSYVWTDPDEPNPVVLGGQTLLDPKRSEEILIENASLMITSNLFQALMLIRGYNEFCTVWVDQICIDQSNLQERASQIQLMQTIFSMANTVLVWLGKAIRSRGMSMFADMMEWLHSRKRTGQIEDAPSFARYTIELMENEPRLCPPPDEKHHLFTKQMAKGILEDPWFSRAWVVQEAVFAKSLSIYLGPVIVPWEFFEKAISGLSYWSIPWSTDEDSALATYHRAGLQTIKNTREWQENLYKGSTLQPSAQLSTMLLGLRVTQATDGRDKVYSFWNLSDQAFRSQKGYMGKLQMTYEKDYQEVYGRTVGYCINTEMTLDVLSCTCKHERSRQDTLFPSWMHDWQANPSDLTCATDLYNILPQRGCDMYTKRSESNGKIPFNACGGRLPHCGSRHKEARAGFTGNFDRIILRGIFFDVVRAVTPNGCTTTPVLQQIADQDKNWKDWSDYATTPIDEDPYGKFVDRLDAFCKAITFGGVKIPGKSDEQVANAFTQWWSAGRPIESSAHSDWSQRLDAYEAFKKLPFPNGLYVDNRRLFRTARGYTGTACEHCKPGDLICILWGGALPFLLRESDDDEDDGLIYHIVGGAVYIHGIMFGEAVKIAEEEGKDEQEFWIA